MRHPEQALQRQVAEWLDWCLAAPWYYSAIGHGGGGFVRGQILKGMGVKRGVADLMFLGPDRMVLWVELKAGNRPTTPEQQAFAHMVESFGHRWFLARTLEDVRDALALCCIPTREHKPSAERIKRLAADLRAAGDAPEPAASPASCPAPSSET